MGNPYGRCSQEGDCGYAEDRLMQSQLTTLTTLPDGTPLRTRSAQGFDVFVNVGAPTYSSFYRERKVDQDEVSFLLGFLLCSRQILTQIFC